MRKAPRPIPANLPDVSTAAALVYDVVHRRNNRLADASLGELVELFSDGTPAWLTGSSCWLPTVFGMPPDRGNDLDVVFSSRLACERFVKGAVAELNRRAPKDQEFQVLTNKLGGSRIVHSDGQHVIDAWYLGEGESIAELVMAYPKETGEHVRVAYQISRNPNAGCLTRIVKVGETKTSYTRGIIDKIVKPLGGRKKKGSLEALAKKPCASSYYGIEEPLRERMQICEPTVLKPSTSSYYGTLGLGGLID